ncbi:MAG TPA: tripartite tricarboxylate transporter substrate-binding protein [Candidatus Binatia bacterium]|nr:tripartite tricarboxylate transporter substrate-binding protein [Candidatus Binatia bacterium]
MRRALMLASFIFVCTASASFAAPAGDDFFKGKVIRIVVGFSAGGGFDTFARTLSRSMGKYIPGNPSIVVENMTGAGSLISANHIYRVAKPDGLTIGAFNGNQILGQLVGAQGINFDARKMEWMGAPGYNHDLCVLSQKMGITSGEQWLALKTPLKLGGSAPGTPTDDGPKILKEAIGLPMRLISGYKGTADIRVAVESGEVDGICGFSWASVRSTWRKAIESGQVIVVMQNAPKAHAELPKVPLAISFAKTAEARQLIESGVHQPSAITYGYSLPPGTPKDRLQILRKAFLQAVKDADFLNDAAKANLEIAPASGEEIEQSIQNLFKTPPAVVAKLKEVLK